MTTTIKLTDETLTDLSHVFGVEVITPEGRIKFNCASRYQAQNLFGQLTDYVPSIEIDPVRST